MHIWRVNVRTQELKIEEIPAAYERLGGRGLIAKMLVEEVPATCDPLGRHNRLIITPGLLVGHSLSCCNRISMGAKSPLTGGVKEANAGGTTGLACALLGIRALVLEDLPAESGGRVLVVSREGVRFDPAGDLAGMGVYACASRLFERYGRRIAMSLIGPAGELGLLAAGIFNADQDGKPARVSARGGLGALMGSRGIKAIVYDPSGCTRPPLQDAAAFKAAQKEFTQAVMTHPQSATYRDFGTAAVGRLSNTYGAIPVRNFSEGQFEPFENISGEQLRQTLLQRGGQANPSHACMPGCVIRCSNVFTGEEDEELVSPIEYETIGLMGSNLDISSLDEIARLNWAVNDVGLDSIDAGAALGVAAEAGLMTFGDPARALELLEEARRGTPLGRIIGSGAALAGKVLGVRRVPAVKGQAMSAYDPRAIKGTGVTYATSPQGADHTAGLTIRAKVDHLHPEGQAALSRTAQINMAGYDTLGACVFAGFGFSAVPTAIRDLLQARYGWEVGTDILQTLGTETLNLEREFNRRAGFTAADDRLPEWMTEEPLAPTQSVFDVPDEDLDGVFHWSSS